MTARFGPAGLDELFYGEGLKSSSQAPLFLHQKGLGAFEYQCTRGVKINESLARKLGEEAAKYNIFLSIHGPYYINFSSLDEQTRVKSCDYIMQSLRAASWMGASVVVFHPGSMSKRSPKEAFELIADGLKRCLLQAREEGYGDIKLAPETGGKKSAFGSLEEIIALCKIDADIIPCIDFAHLHAREGGRLNEKKDFEAILDKLIQELGYERIRHLHCHFSQIEYTAAGERKHWTTQETHFGPDFSLLAQSMVEKNIEPVVICESGGRQSADAKIYQNIYLDAKKKFNA